MCGKPDTQVFGGQRLQRGHLTLTWKEVVPVCAFICVCLCAPFDELLLMSVTQQIIFEFCGITWLS